MMCHQVLITSNQLILHPLVQMLLLLAPKTQDGDGHDANLEAQTDR